PADLPPARPRPPSQHSGPGLVRYTTSMSLTQLLGDAPPARFLEEYYLRLPFARPGGCSHLTHLGSPAAVEALLARPGVDVLVGREGKPWGGQGSPSPEQARALLAEGYTVGVRHAEKHDPALAELA